MTADVAELVMCSYLQPFGICIDDNEEHLPKKRASIIGMKPGPSLATPKDGEQLEVGYFYIHVSDMYYSFSPWLLILHPS